MVTGRPLFPGASEQEQLVRIFKVLGTPTEEIWPSIVELPNYKPDFPKYESRDWSSVTPGLEPSGVELLGEMLVYDPALRESAKTAIEHPYFRDVSEVARLGIVGEPGAEGE